MFTIFQLYWITTVIVFIKEICKFRLNYALFMFHLRERLPESDLELNIAQIPLKKIIFTLAFAIKVVITPFMLLLHPPDIPIWLRKHIHAFLTQ